MQTAFWGRRSGSALPNSPAGGYASPRAPAATQRAASTSPKRPAARRSAVERGLDRRRSMGFGTKLRARDHFLASVLDGARLFILGNPHELAATTG